MLTTMTPSIGARPAVSRGSNTVQVIRGKAQGVSRGHHLPSFIDGQEASVALAASRHHAPALRTSKCMSSGLLSTLSVAAARVFRPASVRKVLDLISSTTTSPASKSEVLRLVKDVQSELGDVAAASDPELLTATWKVMWMSERETHMIKKAAYMLGSEEGDMYHVIDMAERRMENVITFPPFGALMASSDLKVLGEQRMSIKFDTAQLKLNGTKLSLLPWGQGWFKTVWLDEEVMICRDLRDDILIVKRDGPPRAF